jgi:hypothetical protein
LDEKSSLEDSNQLNDPKQHLGILRAICTNITEFPEDEKEMADLYQAKTPLAFRSMSLIRRTIEQSAKKKEASRSRSKQRSGQKRIIRFSRSRSADKENRKEEA